MDKQDSRPEDEDADALEGDAATSAAEGAADGERPASAGEGADEQGEYQAPEFRPSFLESTPAPAEAAGPPPPGDAFFVTVRRDDTTDTHRFEEPAKAQAFIERLLAEGVEEGEIAAFSGHRLAAKVSHRPVVKLLGDPEE